MRTANVRTFLMPDSDTKTGTKSRERVWWFAIVSTVSVLCLLLWLPPGHVIGKENLALASVVAAICIWSFLRCPRRHWFVKLVTFAVMLVALFYFVIFCSALI